MGIFGFDATTTLLNIITALVSLDDALRDIVDTMSFDPTGYSGIWSVVQTAITVSTTVATILVVLYWLVSFINEITEMDWKHLSIWWYFRKIVQLILAKFLIDAAPDLLLSFFKFSSWMMIQFAGGLGVENVFASIDFSTMQQNLEGMNFIEHLLLRVELMVPTLVIRGCQVVIYIIAYSRIIKICLYVIISPISLSTVANGRKSGAWGFVKEYASVVGQSVIIVIIIQIYRGMVNMLIDGSIDGIGGIYKLLVSTIILATCVVGSQKAAKMFLGR